MNHSRKVCLFVQIKIGISRDKLEDQHTGSVPIETTRTKTLSLLVWESPISRYVV